jgi:AraC-like DNA-binding protein
MSPFFVLNGEQKVEILQTGLLPWMKDVFYYVDFFIVFLGIFYSIRSFRTIYRFENMTIYRLTDIQLKATKYFKHFLILNAVLWAIGTAGVFIDFSGVNMPFNLFKIYYLGITILTLWISKFTLYRPDLFSINTVVHKEELQNFIGGRPVVSLEDKNIKEKEESNPSINIKEAEIIIEYLETTKSYLDAKITLQKLADAVGLTKNRLSELLNTEIGLSFNDIINEYRVKEVIRLIPRGLHNQHNISYIGELAGFNSKTTFNRTFKKITDKTPSEFIHDNNSKRQNLKTKL